LAALAVVLVQNVVDDTAEQIAGSSARITAAQVAAAAITTDSDEDEDDERRSACNRLNITYSNAFADSPRRTAFWTDEDAANIMAGGVCGIVSVAVASHMMAAASAACSEASISTVAGFEPAHLGGQTVVYAAAGDPDCHFNR